MRLGLLGDTHGYVPALEVAIRGCREAGVDLIVHCGDFINTPFSPDPPDETIALLRAENVAAICGNGEIYLRDWGNERWPATLARRLRRPDPLQPDFEALVAAGQAALSADSLGWLRQLPDELTLDCARPGDVYVCHSMPGDPFSGIWDSTVRAGIFHGPDPTYAVQFTDEEIDEALSRVGDADLILCGHVPDPLVQHTPLPAGGHALVVRGVGWTQGEPDGTGWTIDYCVLDHVGPARLGYLAWEVHRYIREFRPRDPTWTESSAAELVRE
jgi:Calcineurin-like phosphoesterase superfamily domain